MAVSPAVEAKMDVAQEGDDTSVSVASTQRHEFAWSDITSGCGMWQCPLDAHIGRENEMQVECTLCLQPTPSSAALACPKCRQTACVVCLLRVMEVRRAECYAVCKRCRRTKCSFCRYEFTSPMVELLEIVYRAHVDDLPFTVLTKRTSNDGDAYFDSFYDSTTTDTESTAVTLLTSQALTQQHGFSVEISVVVDRRMLLTIAGAVCAMVLYGSLL